MMLGQLSDLKQVRDLPENFIQVHQSFLVNYEYVQRFGYQQMLLDNGTVIPISLPYRKKVQEQVMKLSAARRDHKR